MKNPQNYKKYYKRWNELINDIIMNIRVKLTDEKLSSLDLSQAESHCVVHDVGFNQQLIAMGVVKTPDNRIMVHYGQYEPEDSIDAQHLNTHTLLRLFKVVEEAIYDYPPKEFDL
jgi:hypothetical protein